MACEVIIVSRKEFAAEYRQHLMSTVEQMRNQKKEADQLMHALRNVYDRDFWLRLLRKYDGTKDTNDNRKNEDAKANELNETRLNHTVHVRVYGGRESRAKNKNKKRKEQSSKEQMRKKELKQKNKKQKV